MFPQLIVAVVVVALDPRPLEGPVRAIDLTIGPRVVRLGEPMQAGHGPISAPVSLSEGVLGHPVDGHPTVQLPFARANLRDVDAEETDRAALDGLLAKLVAAELRQPADPVALRRRCSDEEVRCGMMARSA